MKKIFAFILVTCAWSAWAQTPSTTISIVSPNSTSLGTFGESPTSLFSGTTSIAVPMYELKEGSLSVPIALSYNTSGVRPDQHPGWTGVNWSLDAGGMITRVVKGIPDEFNWTEDILDSNQDDWHLNYPFGYGFHTGRLNSATWSASANVTQIAKDGIDADPDEFIFNFAGVSGKFYMDHTGNWQVVAQPGFKIEVEMANIGGGPYFYLASPYISNIDAVVNVSELKFWGFRITTPDGTKYDFGLFGEAQQTTANFAVEASMGFFEENYLGESWDSWYLRKITSADGLDEITFSYDMGSPIASFTRTIAMDKKSGSSTPRGILGIFGPVSARSFSIIERYDGKLILPVYLKKISSKNFEVNFTRTVTNELKYDYAAILQSLGTHVDPNNGTYSSAVHSYPARMPIAGRWQDFLNGQAEVAALVRTDINAYAVNGNVTNYYNNYFLEWAAGGEYTGIVYDPNLIPTNYPYHVYEVIDFGKLRWSKLDKVEIVNKKFNTTGTELVKSFNLSYTSSSSQRLMLLSVQETGKSGASNPPYTFEYEDVNSNYYTGSYSLPPYNSYKTDHWGFYNGTDARLGLDFSDPATLTAFKDKKEPVADYLYSGILNKITYPTGGFSKFTYEPNQYNKVVTRNVTTGAFSVPTLGTPKMAGGLRIKEIIHGDDYDYADVVKTYEYSGGILGGESKYYWPGYRGKFLESGATYTSDRFVTETILPLSTNSAGSHIGYSKVIERTSGNGRIEYTYSNHDTNVDENFIVSIDLDKSPYSPFTAKDFERGNPLNISTYSETNKLLKEEIFTYQANSLLTGTFVRSVATKQIPVFDGWTIEGTSYKVYSHPYNLYQKTSRVYDESTSNFVSTVNEFTYNNKNLIRQDRLTANSTGSVLDKVTYYVSDYSATAMSGMVGTLQTKNIQIPVVDSRMVRDANVVQGSVYEYNELGKVTKEHIFESTTPVALSFNASSIVPNTTYYFPRTEYFYDQTTKRLSSFYDKVNEPKSYLWGYNNKLPVAEARNAANDKRTITTVTQGTGTSGITMGGTPPVVTTRSITVDYTGTVSIELGVPGTPAYTTYCDYSSGFGSGTLTLSNGQSCGFNKATFSNVPPGTYTVTLTLRSNTTVSSLGACGQIKYPSNIVTVTNPGAVELFYDGFEESTQVVNTNAHTGRKCFVGDYTVNFTRPNTKTYTLEYWYFDGTTWQYISKPYTTNTAVLSEGNAIDDVRIYPTDAFMKSYTYEPGLGMTSAIEENGRTLYYEYDTMGRLIHIKNEKGGIETKYSYHYKGGN
jgi:hypothetical protein